MQMLSKETVKRIMKISKSNLRKFWKKMSLFVYVDILDQTTFAIVNQCIHIYLRK